MNAELAAFNPTCPHCGLMHNITCPRIKALEYHPDGRLKRVEFHEQRDKLKPEPAIRYFGEVPM